MRKTGLRSRILAMLLCFLMVFTTIPTDAFAAETTINETQDTKEASVPEITEESKESEFDDLQIDEIIEDNKKINDAMSDFDAEEFEIEEIQNDAITQSIEEGIAPVADDTSIQVNSINVMMQNSDGYQVIHTAIKKDDTNYHSYLVPGLACPTTIPEPAITTATSNITYKYVWDDSYNNSYISIVIPTGCSIADAKWENNVLKFKVQDESQQIADFTLTLQSIDLGEITLAQVVEKIQQADFGITMADSYDAVKSKIESVEGLPSDIKLKLSTSQNNYKHTAQAGKLDNINGQDGAASLYVSFYFADVSNNSNIYFYKNNNSTIQITAKVKALAYSEEDKVTLTANANGNGTAKADFVGMVAKAQSDKSYKWMSQYTISATPGENNRLVIWTYKDGETTKTAGTNAEITVTSDIEQTYTANFAVNSAPTVKTGATATLNAKARQYTSQSFTSVFQDTTSMTVDGKSYSITDKLTYSATMDGKALSTEEFSGTLKWATNDIGEHKLVITATDDLGASATHTVTVNVAQVGTPTEYKLGIKAFYQGKAISLGEDGLDADISYYSGANANFPVESLESDFYNKSDKYLVQIEKWAELGEKYNFAEFKIGNITISAADSLSTTAKYYTVNGYSKAVKTQYDKSKDQLKIWINNSKNLILKEDTDLQLYFDNIDVKLTVEASENGSFVSTIFDGKENGKYTYVVYAKPDKGYQLVSYTVKGETEPVPLELTVDNYRQTEQDSLFRISIEEDTEITLNFAPATMELKLYGYNISDRMTEVIANWQILREINSRYDKKVTLFEGACVKFWFTVEMRGFLSMGTEVDKLNCLKIYQGESTDEDKIIFDSSDPYTGYKGSTYGPGNATESVLNGGQEVQIYATILNCPDIENQKITVVLNYGGYQLKKTFDIQTSSGIPELTAYKKYYEDTYGLDKFGDAAYTSEEKQTESYAKYCKYSNFRYVMREVYNNYSQRIIQAQEANRETLLTEAKQKLDDVATGKGYNCVVWNFIEGNGVDDIPVMVAVPAGASAHVTMCAALEALYPGNWTYGYSATQFGAFVNNVDAGGENNTGCIKINNLTTGTTGSSYGFWYYNGKFSDLGVSNYTTNDGDVMWWGGGDIDRNWAWAKLRLYYGSDAALDAELTKRGATKAISAMTGAEIEKLFSDLDDGSGLSFFRRYGQFRDVENWELVVIKIAAIGSVNTESGETIKAARDAYDALSQAEQNKVTNYQTLLDAEAAYKTLTEKATVTYTDALDGTLTKLGTQTLGVGTTNGEWAVLALARGGKTVSDSYYNAALAHIQKELDSSTNRLEANKSSDNSRLILALTAIGKDATNINGKNLVAGLSDLDYIKNQGINGTAYALMAINSHAYTPSGVTREQLIQSILTAQLADGGWALSGTETDVDITAMVLQALAPYYESRTDVKVSVDKALTKLKTLQKSTGGFCAYGDVYNAETTAQMVVALSALKIDAATWNGHDAVDALLHFYDSEKSMFRHDLTGDVDQMATEQSAYALVAYDRYKNNKNRLYDMTDVIIEGTTAPTTPECIALEISGNYKNLYNVGEELDLTGIVLTAYWTSGDPTTVKLDDSELKITGYDKTKAGPQEVTLTYKEKLKAVINVTVSKPDTKITVSVTILGDDTHDSTGGTHGYAMGGLKEWAKEENFEADSTESVWAVLQRVFTKYNMTVKTQHSSKYNSIYIAAINGLGEFTNGSFSGWMYMVNGKHPNVGVSAVTVKQGDEIILHYTDDFNYEEGGVNDGKPVGEDAYKNVIALIDRIDPEITLDSEKTILAAREAYSKLTQEQKALVTNYQTLLDAEKKLAELKTDQSVSDVYKATGDYLEKLGTPDVGSIGGDWMALGLARSGRTVPAGYYDKVVSYVKENIDSNGRLHTAKSTDNSRLILALTAAGYDPRNVGGYNLVTALSDMDYVEKQGINGPIWALIALDSHSYATVTLSTGNSTTRTGLVKKILSAQLADGGWAISGTTADSDMTGMALQALAPYYDSNETVKAAVDKALTKLSSMQEDNGGYATVGTITSESTAQVIVALSALGIDADTDSRFIKNGFSAMDALLSFAVDGGGFRHIAGGNRDGMATEQGYYALTAYMRMKDGKTSLYDMSDVTLKAGTVTGDTNNSGNSGSEDKDQEAAKKVEALIDTIDTVTVNSGSQLRAIRAAYDKLTASQKKLVSNYEKLTKAEETYGNLKAAQVEKLIAAIGKVTLDSRDKINAARAAYRKLGAAYKAKVSNLEVLEAAEEEYQALLTASKKKTSSKKTDTIVKTEEEASSVVQEDPTEELLTDSVYTDAATGISISGVTWNVQLVVEEITDQEKLESLKSSLNGNALLKGYHIELLDLLTGEAYEPTEAVLVKLPLELLGDYSSYDGLAVVHYTEDGTVEYLDCTLIGDCISFYAAELSDYAVVGYEGISPMEHLTADTAAEASEGMEWLPWTVTGCFGAALLAVLAILANKNRKNTQAGE